MLTLQACAATTTGTSFPPGGGPVGLSDQASSSFSGSTHFQPSRHSFRPSSTSTTTSNNNSNFTCRKRSYPHDGQTHDDSILSNRQEQHEINSSDSVSTTSASSAAVETSLQCPRLQTQQLCLPRKSTQPLATLQGLGVGQCPLDPSIAKANFVDSLVGKYISVHHWIYFFYFCCGGGAFITSVKCRLALDFKPQYSFDCHHFFSRCRAFSIVYLFSFYIRCPCYILWSFG